MHNLPLSVKPSKSSAKPPLISVVINNHNYAHFLSGAIESVLAQQHSFGEDSVEVVVVDDGSTDQSHAVIASYGNKIVPVLKANGGQDSAFNAGFARCKGEFVCLLDADDRFAPDKLEQIVRCVRAHRDIGWCFHALRLEDTRLVHAVGNTSSNTSGNTIGTTRAFGGRGRDRSQVCDFRESLRFGTLPFYPPATSGLCFRRSLLACILPMPETFINTSADRYVRIAAMSLAPGYFLADELTIQGIHGNNVSTLRCDRPSIPERQIVVAYLLRTQFPELSQYADRLFSRGLSAYNRCSPETLEPEYADFIRDYWQLCSPMDSFLITLLRLYRDRPWRAVTHQAADYYNFTQSRRRAVAKESRVSAIR